MIDDNILRADAYAYSRYQPADCFATYTKITVAVDTLIKSEVTGDCNWVNASYFLKCRLQT